LEDIARYFPLYAILWIPWILIIVAASAYARRMHSRAALGVAVGAAGYLVCAAVAQVWSAAYTYGDLLPEGFGLWLEYRRENFTWLTMALGVAFVLVFAVSLVLVLRDAGRRRAITPTVDSLRAAASGPSACDAGTTHV
jgi:hypothetical protein